MNTHHLLEPSEMPPTAFSGLHPRLHVVLVYEDFEMGVEGKEIFDLIAREAGGEGEAHLTVWRFDFFHSPELTLALSRQAEEADVIIVALRNSSYLPPHVRRWLERWPQRRRNTGGAIVAVFHPDDATARSSDAALQLWRAAERASMDFFARTKNVHTSGTGTTGAAASTPPVSVYTRFAPHRTRSETNMRINHQSR